ncbi:MAG: CcmD family protein [Caldilineaceae bacterium SB0665_bin_21]|nr:CcmD family protein [Caldilineaceae bacterium SB0665_bin_21]MYA03488.1 CcmD family protein [Caldilineaceae bacterium SB0664_bin_22]MYC64107.1 CcmD family protein [Caldilineaceae bacterium SB0661_bin_34]
MSRHPLRNPQRMQYLFLALAVVWTITLLYVVFLINKQKQLETLIHELQQRQDWQSGD